MNGTIAVIFDVPKTSDGIGNVNNDNERANRAWGNVLRGQIDAMRNMVPEEEQDTLQDILDEAWRDACMQNEDVIRAKHPHLIKYLD